VATMLKVLASIAIPLAALLTGLRAASTDWLWLWKRPSLLWRSLLAILVLVPIGAVLLLDALGASDVVKNGVIAAVVAIGIGPAAALKQTKAGDERVPYEIGLDLTLLVLSIIYLPIMVTIHAALFHSHVQIGAGQVAGVVLSRALIPLGIGVLAARVFPRIVTPACRYGGFLVDALLLVVVLVALVAEWRPLLSIGGAGWLGCFAAAALAVLIGHLLGGPEPATRGVLAFFSATRFPALALLLVSAAPRGREILPAVLAYLIASIVVVAAYGAVLAARAKRRHAPVAAPANA
jgi:bile acid:Na+ symporter, BASS family